MTAEDALGIYRNLERARVPIWLNGGWSVDALVGRQTRPHRDLDLFVELRHLPALRQRLATEGFAETPGGRPENFVLRDSRRREVDVHVFELDVDGRGLYPMEDGRTWICPAEGLRGAGRLLGQDVRCFTPELELQCHSGYELDDDDRRDIAQLQEAFPHAAPLPVEIGEGHPRAFPSLPA